jgi:two-component system chemotaxis response regulator CheY
LAVRKVWRCAVMRNAGEGVMDSQLRCLIVDDSAFMRFHLKRLMDSFENVVASEATNGNEAISEYRRLRPDIVLMDIVMPGLEGVETVRQICEVDPAARVIMISSVSYRAKVEEAMAAGAKYFIPKPVTTDDLRQAIERVLRPGGAET